MTTRRTGTLTALILTAALFALMPGLLRSARPADANRMAESLRPPRLRTLTIWLLSGENVDRRLITQACASFEKERKGVRIFLRSVDAQELLTPDAVLPDLVLFETGGISVPEKVLLPLADGNEPSGMYAGVSYAQPLWLSPNVLCIPHGWLGQPSQETTGQPSLLAAATPEPTRSDLLAPEEIPWDRLLEPGALRLPAGVALQQLMSMCPYPQRGQLSRAEDSQEAQATVCTLAEAMQREDAASCLLTPAVSDRVRYAALCRDSEDARAFLSHLQDTAAQSAPEFGLVPASGAGSSNHVLVMQALELFSGTKTLPNAFAHTREEIRALCSDAFQRCADPVETLLKLR